LAIVVTILSTEGIAKSSSASARARYVWRRDSNDRSVEVVEASSLTIEESSPPQPHSRGFSSTVNRRPVADTSRRIVVMSRGTNERHVHDRALNTGVRKFFGGGECLGDHRPQRDNRCVRAFAKTFARAECVQRSHRPGTSIFDA